MPALPLPPQPFPSYAMPAGLDELRASVRRRLAHLASPSGQEDSNALRIRLSNAKVDGPQTLLLKRALRDEDSDRDQLEETVCPSYAKP